MEDVLEIDQPRGVVVIDNRFDSRYDTRLPGMLLVHRDHSEVMVENLSRGGAFIRGDQAMPEKGDEVVLAAGNLRIVATVAWRQDNVCGLRFHRPIKTPVLHSHVD